MRKFILAKNMKIAINVARIDMKLNPSIKHDVFIDDDFDEVKIINHSQVRELRKGDKLYLGYKYYENIAWNRELECYLKAKQIITVSI